MDTGILFVGAIIVGMVIAIIAFSIRKSTRDAGVSEHADTAGSQGVDPGIASLMTPGILSNGSMRAGSDGHTGHHAHGHHAHDGGQNHGSHASFDSCAPVDSGGGFEAGGCGDAGGGCGDGGGGDGGGGD